MADRAGCRLGDLVHAVADPRSIDPAHQERFGEDVRVVSRWTASGTHTGPLNLPSGPVTPTGSRISFDEIRIDRHSGGKIAES
jgi:hypothetical protein